MKPCYAAWEEMTHAARQGTSWAFCMMTPKHEDRFAGDGLYSNTLYLEFKKTDLAVYKEFYMSLLDTLVSSTIQISGEMGCTSGGRGQICGVQGQISGGQGQISSA